jgi:hypothetical protein
MGLSLCVIYFFCLKAFSILSLFSVLVILMIIYCGVVLFWLSLFVVLEGSCTWMGNSFLRFGKFSVFILLNILCIPLACTYPSSVLMILKFGLSMEWLSSCIYLSQLLSCLTKIFSVFFFNFCFIFELWDSVFHVLVCWIGLPLCFLFD